MLSVRFLINNSNLLSSLLLLGLSIATNVASTLELEELETINFKGPDGSEHVELAFRPPMEGLPQHALDVFCASTKMRLYWGVLREEIKETHRKGFHLRHAARMAKHVFSDVRDADKPFNATMLSKVDKWFAAKFDNQQDGETATDDSDSDEDNDHATTAPSQKLGDKIAAASKKKIHDLKSKLIRQKSGNSKPANKDCAEEDKKCKKDNNSRSKSSDDGEETTSEQREEQKQFDSFASDSTTTSDEQPQIDDIDASKLTGIKKQLKGFLKKWSPKVAMSIYTRWRTLWWLMMSCLFTKYYLWDPALDEFTKLKRNLVMWPQLQLVKLKELQCKPVQLFRRILDVCKILNPLLNINFGLLSLDKPTRFKGDIN